MHVMTARSHRERWDRFAVPLPGEPTCIVASRGSDADEDVLHAQLVSLYGIITACPWWYLDGCNKTLLTRASVSTV